MWVKTFSCDCIILTNVSVRSIIHFWSKINKCVCWGMHYECLAAYFQKYKWLLGDVFSGLESFYFNKMEVTWKFCPRNFKNSEIDCTISQKKNHSELQKFKKDNVAAIWLCKKLWLRRPETFENEWQKREHLLRILFNVARVVHIKLFFTDWFFCY